MSFWKRVIVAAGLIDEGGKRGDAKADPATAPVSRTTVDPWPDRAHQPLPNTGRWPKNKPGTAKMIPEEANYRPSIPGMYTDIGQYVGSFKRVAMDGLPFEDVVRDVQVKAQSPNAPDSTGNIADNPRPTGWVHMGDNGIEVYPSNHHNDGKLMANLIKNFQDVRMIPSLKRDMNKVGQWTGDHVPEEGAIAQEPAPIMRHLMRDHMVLPQQVQGLDINQLNEYHMLLHESGQNTHNPEVQIVANILDPIQTSLDPDVFDNPEGDKPRLKDNIAAWVEAKVHQVFLKNGYDNIENWLRLVLTGSLTTLQWSPDSDFDVSLWIDLEEFEDFDRSEIVKMIVDELDGAIVPNTTHPLQCFVVNVNEIEKMSEIYRPGIRSAWDIEEREWIVPPEHNRAHSIEQEFPDSLHRALQAAEKMKMLLKYQPDRAKVYWDYIHHQRRVAMKQGKDDFCDENITYKMMANSGLFPKIEEVTGEHIASYRLSSYEDDGITYYNIKAFLPEYNPIVKTATSLDSYEVDKRRVEPGEIGQFSWVDTGFKVESEGVEVHPDFRRQGTASAMIEMAKTITPNIRASSYRTPEGDLFLEATNLLEEPEEINFVRLEPRYSQNRPGIQVMICKECGTGAPILNDRGVCQSCEPSVNKIDKVKQDILEDATELFSAEESTDHHSEPLSTTNPHEPPEFK